MRILCTVLLGWVLPLVTFAETAARIELRLIEGNYRPGDVIELHAEMQSLEYAEFVLHVPEQSQLHFVAHTREPVRYREGAYSQRAVLLLQPKSAGRYDLNMITATVEQGGIASEIALPAVQFEVESYGAEDTSTELAELDGTAAVLPQPVDLWGLIFGGLVVLIIMLWFIMRKVEEPSTEPRVLQPDLNDLIVVLETGESGSVLIEQILNRADLVLSPVLRTELEATAYGNALDFANLIALLRKEVTR